jgi:AraC-like DNA-binding protein
MFDVFPQAALSPDIALLSSLDVDQAREMLNRFYYPVSVGTPEGIEGFEFDLQVIQLGPLTIGQLSFGAAVTVVVADFDGYHVTLPTAGRVLTRQGGHEVIADPGVAAVFRPGRPVYSLHDAHSSEMDIKIKPAALEDELSALLGRRVVGPIDLAPEMPLRDGPGRSWSRLIQLVRDELEQPHSLIHYPLIAEQLRQCVLTGLLFSLPHRYHAELLAPAPPGPPRAIQRAVDAVNDEPERPFSVAELAEIAGMSVRSLQEGFRRHVGCAPMAYLQQVRLLRAHDALRRADPTRITVAAVAHRWGFAHLGRFAAAYRTRFGQTPSETLRQLN